MTTQIILGENEETGIRRFQIGKVVWEFDALKFHDDTIVAFDNEPGPDGELLDARDNRFFDWLAPRLCKEAGIDKMTRPVCQRIWQNVAVEAKKIVDFFSLASDSPSFTGSTQETPAE
jgi:hypothetical protein